MTYNSDLQDVQSNLVYNGTNKKLVLVLKRRTLTIFTNTYAGSQRIKLDDNYLFVE